MRERNTSHVMGSTMIAQISLFSSIDVTHMHMVRRWRICFWFLDGGNRRHVHDYKNISTKQDPLLLRHWKKRQLQWLLPRINTAKLSQLI